MFESRLVCKELGFSNGTLLPQGSFGKYNKYPLTQVTCQGTEDSIFSCSFNTKKVCSNKYFGYAAITRYWFEIEIKDFFEYHKYFIRQSGDRN
jgi:hypothetical protein